MEVLVYADRNDKKSAENILEKFKIVSYLIDYVFFKGKFVCVFKLSVAAGENSKKVDKLLESEYYQRNFIVPNKK